jgi:mannose-6-phosphate isomerase-like protein (cupin superfamily)
MHPHTNRLKTADARKSPLNREDLRGKLCVNVAMKTDYDGLPTYLTKDGSLIRELMHPGVHDNRNQSLAEAVIAAGTRTLLHRHRDTEELYHVTRGAGRMTLGAKQFDVTVGDTICIAPGTPHCIENTGDAPLHILCCCAPAYSHADTELLEGGTQARTLRPRRRPSAAGQ